MYSEQLKQIIDRREKDIVEDSQLPPEKRKNLKPSQLTKAQKDKLKDLADEFLSEFGNAEELSQRYQLFLIAASKIL